MFRRIGRVAVIVLVFACALAPAAAAQVQPYGTNDYGGFRNILPPGQNGLDDAAQAAAFKAAGVYPPHANDQLGMYSGLTTAAPITESQIPQFYKDATFGVPAGDVAGTESPEPGVTIERDSKFGVPHIYGDTRAALMFGIGYASAEDRLFFMDVLRHAGRGELAQFAGGANVGMDESVWQNEPYNEQDLTNQINWGAANLPDGQQIMSDATNYIDGINAYISAAKSPLNALTMMPAEYAAIGQPLGPQPFTVNDIVAIATLVGGIFGNGGGQQLSNAVLYEGLKAQFGPEHFTVAGSPELIAQHKAKKKKHKGKPKTKKSGQASPDVPGAVPAGVHARRPTHRVRPGTRRAGKAGLRAGRLANDHSGFATFMSFDDPSDPEAPTTERGKSFPYQTLPNPSKAVLKTLALPDPGSVQYVNPVSAGAVPAGESGSATAGSKARPATGASNLSQSLLAFGRGMSNALVVSGADSASGHPLAVMGPQVSYFSPQILIEQDEHGPGIDAEGAAFPGTNLYVQLGHGQDYAWSATSSGQNIIDTFAAPLCNPSGGAAAIDSDYYLLNGQCVQMETLTRSESWQPNLGDSTPAGSVTFQTKRTAYGIVIARGRIKGQPVVYTNLRSTYMHELDSAVGFERFNEPAEMRNPQDFMNAAYNIGYTFNWFYADDQHIAYFNSGQNPVRAPHTNPLFPTWAVDAWPGLHPAAAMTPASLTEQQTPQSAHPQTIDQSVITSWNNKQAPGYNDTATAEEYSSVFRSQLLDQNIDAQLSQSGGKMTLADLINAMGNAGTQDLRGVEVLPYALRVIGHPSDPALANAVDELQTWVASGAHRINHASPGASGSYEQSDAIRIMDAWWPLLVNAEFGPVLGSGSLGQVESDFPIDDPPSNNHAGAHTGSSFDVGFYGIVQKDLRAALGDKVDGPLNRIYCGGGSLTQCRAQLESSLRQAVGESAQQVYPGDSNCAAGDQMCSDSIQFRPIGVITQPLIEWVNRPTFQQADEIEGHGPR
ncbi:MAG TPA: penicillin acylase family protein [Solirubrobacteraceae bacterium]|nr:penicillin acylase family protein [Solirubrobacteraceae bacterium]